MDSVTGRDGSADALAGVKMEEDKNEVDWTPQDIDSLLDGLA